MLKAVFNSVIIKPIEEEKTYGSIVVPDLGKEVGIRGEIVSVGPGSYMLGTFIETTLKEGQKVILPPIGPVRITDEGQEYWSCLEQQVLAIIE